MHGRRRGRRPLSPAPAAAAAKTVRAPRPPAIKPKCPECGAVQKRDWTPERGCVVCIAIERAQINDRVLAHNEPEPVGQLFEGGRVPATISMLEVSTARRRYFTAPGKPAARRRGKAK